MRRHRLKALSGAVNITVLYEDKIRAFSLVNSNSAWLTNYCHQQIYAHQKKRCYSTIIGYDTSGFPIFVRKCFCGTTACMDQDELTPKAEEAFYKKAFSLKWVAFAPTS